MTLTVGSLFSGIGGLELGLERAGMRVAWQVECDEYALKVLAKHWPEAKRYTDVRAVTAEHLAPVDVLCGGFPCQDISGAGEMAGITGNRSGLWVEFRRLIRELRPRYVLVENVAALLVRGFDAVLGDLAASGFDAEWDCLPACSVGAPHRRDRLFVVAYPAGARLAGVFHAHPGAAGSAARPLRGKWEAEPDVGRVAHGVPSRVDRLRCLGNAVVPQVAEFIGRRILAREAA